VVTLGPTSALSSNPSAANKESYSHPSVCQLNSNFITFNNKKKVGAKPWVKDFYLFSLFLNLF
jgi:hypothetical protein